MAIKWTCDACDNEIDLATSTTVEYYTNSLLPNKMHVCLDCLAGSPALAPKVKEIRAMHAMTKPSNRCEMCRVRAPRANSMLCEVCEQLLPEPLVATPR